MNKILREPSGFYNEDILSGYHLKLKFESRNGTEKNHKEKNYEHSLDRLSINAEAEIEVEIEMAKNTQLERKSSMAICGASKPSQ
jgi:hypothetical protein